MGETNITQLDKCKTCLQYIVTNIFNNGIFYGCKLGKPLNYNCNIYLKTK